MSAWESNGPEEEAGSGMLLCATCCILSTTCCYPLVLLAATSSYYVFGILYLKKSFDSDYSSCGHVNQLTAIQYYSLSSLCVKGGMAILSCMLRLCCRPTIESDLIVRHQFKSEDGSIRAKLDSSSADKSNISKLYPEGFKPELFRPQKKNIVFGLLALLGFVACAVAFLFFPLPCMQFRDSGLWTWCLVNLGSDCFVAVVLVLLLLVPRTDEFSRTMSKSTSNPLLNGPPNAFNPSSFYSPPIVPISVPMPSPGVAQKLTGPYADRYLPNYPPYGGPMHFDTLEAAVTAGLAIYPLCRGVTFEADRGQFSLRQGSVLQPSMTGEVSYIFRDPKERVWKPSAGPGSSASRPTVGVVSAPPPHQSPHSSPKTQSLDSTGSPLLVLQPKYALVLSDPHIDRCLPGYAHWNGPTHLDSLDDAIAVGHGLYPACTGITFEPQSGKYTLRQSSTMSVSPGEVSYLMRDPKDRYTLRPGSIGSALWTVCYHGPHVPVPIDDLLSSSAALKGDSDYDEGDGNSFHCEFLVNQAAAVALFDRIQGSRLMGRGCEVVASSVAHSQWMTNLRQYWQQRLIVRELSNLPSSLTYSIGGGGGSGGGSGSSSGDAVTPRSGGAWTVCVHRGDPGFYFASFDNEGLARDYYNSLGWMQSRLLGRRNEVVAHWEMNQKWGVMVKQYWSISRDRVRLSQLNPISIWSML